MPRSFALALSVCALAAVHLAWPQAMPPPEQAPGSAPFEGRLFPPDLVMKHQSEIGLDERQREALVQELQRTQSDLIPLQFEMSEAGESLTRLLDRPQVDEAKVLAEADRVMKLESQIKRRHLTLLVRIKNLLSAEQQEKLQRLRPRPQP